jgi:hypothetical protein
VIDDEEEIPNQELAPAVKVNITEPERTLEIFRVIESAKVVKVSCRF